MIVTAIASAVTTAATTGSADAMEWYRDSACAGLDTEMFYAPEGMRGPSKRAHDAAAKRVCAKCIVTAQCLSWAVSMGEMHGVWGGLTGEERAQLWPAQAAT